MKKVLILCVNYGSYNELYDYLQSVNTASQKMQTDFTAEVMIADNTVENHQNIDAGKYENCTVKIFPFHKNYGYCGGISTMIQKMQEVKFSDYNYVIISNVDIILSPTFFEKLINNKFPSNIAWVAPRIYSLQEKRDRNPSQIQRPNLKKIRFRRFIYQHPLFMMLYMKTLYKIRKRNNSTSYRGKIYEGHGAIMIFSGIFFEDNRNFHFPVFLGGEETFFAELVRKWEGIVFYEPSVEVFDIGNISTGKISFKKKTKIYAEFYNKMEDLYYKD